MELPYLEFSIGSMIAVYLVETYLDFRKHAAIKLPTPPKYLKGLISQEKFEKSRAYSLDRSYFNFVSNAVDILIETGILYFGLIPWFWKKSGELVVYMGLNADNEIIHSLSFFAGVMIWLKIKRLPLSLYSVFVIDAQHGLNKRTISLFFWDKLKWTVVMIIFGAPLLSALIVLVHKGGPYLTIYLWGFVSVSAILLMTLYPILIAPLFNKYTPLPAGEVRQETEKLAASLKFPLTKLYVIDGSTRHNFANAYVFGIGNNKRIVLYDTLLQQHKNVEEIVAILAHELGHWQLWHTWYTLIFTQVYISVLLGGYTLMRNSRDIFQSFGFDTQPVIIGLILFQYLMTAPDALLGFSRNALSRAIEFQADAFSKKLGYAKALKSGLLRMEENCLAAVNTDPWSNAYYNSHPTVAERIAALDVNSAAKKKNSKLEGSC